MHRDRLIQLTKFTKRNTVIGSKLKTPLLSQPHKDQFTEVRQLIKTISNKTQQINELRHDYKKTYNQQKEKEVTEKMDNIIKQNKDILSTTFNCLKQLDKKFKDGQKKAITVDLARKAKINIQNLRQAEEKFTNAVKETIKRQATFIQGDISEDQLNQLLTNPEKGQQLLKNKLLDAPSVQLQNAVSDIMDKYREILLLQKSIHQCMDLTRQLALLVSMQGDQIDNIQTTLKGAQDYVENADVALGKAKQHHKSAKKKMFCLIALILLVIGVIVIPVVITQT